MALRELYHPEGGRMRVVGLMSGSGSNLIKIIEHEKHLEETYGISPYHVSVIFTDNPSSNAEKIAAKYSIPILIRDLNAFYKDRGKPKKDMGVRAEFDSGTARALSNFGIDAAAYAGYMAIATEPLTNAFLGVNVHPADLSVMKDGKRKYTGDHAVRDAILGGERFLRSTTHIVEPQVDQGRILMISSPIQIVLPEDFNLQDGEKVKAVSDEHQNRLKEFGDWVIFPRTLEYIADGKYCQDESGLLYLNNKPIPQGWTVGSHR